MRILILGSGGREHTLAWKMSQSPLCDSLFVAPGNSGTFQVATNFEIDPTNFEAVIGLVKSEAIDMVVVGPEEPLVLGIHDAIKSDKELENVAVIGPAKAAAELEGSKAFAKAFMNRHNIPTAAHDVFTADSLQKGLQFLSTLKPPYVLKADGLAAGKGVLIIDSLNEAQATLKDMLENQTFGEASRTVVIEEFLSGIELSCFVLTDGKSYKILPMAKDYKRIGEGDTGLNTGGMGAVSPVPFVDEMFYNKVESRIVRPTIAGLQKDQLPYIGVVFIGLIKVNDDPFVIEYNVRFGDPETEVVIPRIKSDLVELFASLNQGNLKDYPLEIDERTAATVMMVSGGYPGDYEKGKEIFGMKGVDGLHLFHAGAIRVNDKTLTSGGRVMAVTAFGENHKVATKKIYDQIEKINFDGKNYRKDIGFDL
ncbi:MAG: phosphoribosylamine--glycine ligase [Bacteroidetes bacterium]|nr:phosphoribosylamine--glycine ligase [Bacteroidota bacterium]MDA0879027.1 phosphoribosylamine--glycine ligase [Bacteroidota bacterium]MDA1115934.1 phosphoribosylamine--glycine ligase [Bacteroidota bacterium]